MNVRLVRHALVLLAIVLTIGCDRVTKHVARMSLPGTPARSYLADTIRVVYAENQGGFLGAGEELPPAARTLLFTGMTGLALAALVLAGFRRQWNRLATLGLALLVAGGASNWYDRVARGTVVDFLNVGVGPVRTGVFNTADVAIMVGAGLFVLAELRRK